MCGVFRVVRDALLHGHRERQRNAGVLSPALRKRLSRGRLGRRDRPCHAVRAVRACPVRPNPAANHGRVSDPRTRHRAAGDRPGAVRRGARVVPTARPGLADAPARAEHAVDLRRLRPPVARLGTR